MRAFLILLLLSALSCSREGPAPAVPGTQVLFDLDADASKPASFFDFPFPSDLGLLAGGTPETRGFPNPGNVALVGSLRKVGAQRRGFPSVPVAYFRFQGAVTAQDPKVVIPADTSSPILLIDLDERRLLPTVAATIPKDAYVPEHVLGVAPRPGFILAPERRHAFVVLRQLRDAQGELLGVPSALETLKAGRIPAGSKAEAAAQLYAPLFAVLKALKLDVADVAAATVFTTGDVVKDLFELTEKVLAAHDVAITDLGVDPDDGAAHPRFCELHGRVSYPQFQRGTPPFDSEGLFELGADGVPLKQREEVAKVVITLPKQPMPAGGYPLALYFHGSGGLSTSGVDRGRWRPETDPAKCPEKTLGTWNGGTGCNIQGEGPAHVLAPFGIGTAASGLPVNPERLPGAAETAYLNFQNLAAFRDTFRQGVIEQRLLLEALTRLTIPASAVAACQGLSLPAGENAYRFATEVVLAQGQSMGGMYTNLISAVEPRIKASVPTGAGGFWTYFILETKLIDEVAAKVALLLAVPDTRLTFLHPVMHLFELAVEPVDPIVYMPRMAKRPLSGHPVRSIYAPVGKDDSYFPTVVYDAAALAYGHGQAGEEVWPETEAALALDGRSGRIAYPVQGNAVSVSGAPYTGVVVQYPGDGVFDPHALYSQRDEVKHQYGCFFSTFLGSGAAKVVAPAPLGSACQ